MSSCHDVILSWWHLVMMSSCHDVILSCHTGYSFCVVIYLPYLPFAMFPVSRRSSLSGSFAVKGVENPSYKSFKLSECWPPNFTKLELEFEGNVKLAFADPRRLGRIRFRGLCLVLSCVVLTYVVLCCWCLFCLFLPSLALSCLALPFVSNLVSNLALFCLVVSCLVLSCLVLSCLVLSCLSCLVLNCLV